MRPISKSQFLNYLTCPKDAWFRIHKPELEEFKVSATLQHIFDQGYEAEAYAERLKVFTGMVEVKSRGEEAQKETQELLVKKVPAIFQPTFVADGFMCRCDALVWNGESHKWDLYEIKSSSSRHDTGARDHLSDAAFQAVVLERCGVALGRVFIVHLNREYIRKGELDIEALFVQEDSTELVNARRVTVVGEMELAKKYLLQETEPKGGCDCIYYGRSSHCDSFALSHPHVPEYSVHDLYAIGKSSNKLRALIEQDLYHLHEIEDSSEFNDRQQNQIETFKSKEAIVVKHEIENVLRGYSYPLYFFDYETFAPAVPIFDGYKPYQRMPIQFSLHYIEKKDGPLLHAEYVHVENSDPSEAVAKKLIEMIDPKGTVLAWNVGFERSVTEELAKRLPAYAIPLRRICDQMQDLMEVFSKQHYVHHGFRGSAAIENVMNVMLPDMTYDHLPYTGQDVGFVWWEDIVSKRGTDRDEKLRLITEYCKQDTFVMVEIWRILNEMIAK
jgi:CRISPR/Cas system-associated exonuclease Cas4 (RecB family)